ncbi:MAG TPA: DUF6542 domain-containing protein [Streptosporangiaceae bacterium]
MSEPRWHDSDPRPPFGSAPGPGFRPARNVPEPPTGGYRRLGDGKPAAWEEPGWYREDPEQARTRAAQEQSAQDWRVRDRSAQDRLAQDRPARDQPARDRPAQGRPAPRRPASSGWTDPFRAVPMSGPRPDEAAGAGGPRETEDDGRPARSWRWGQLSGGQGLGIVVIAAGLGALVSVATKHEPGTLLGGFVVAGSLGAVLAVRQRSAYLMIPVPVLCYLVFALAAGLARSQSAPSSSALTVNAAQWIANGFLTMAAATVVAIVITAGRWFWARQARGAEADPRPQAGPAGRGRPDPRDTPGVRETRGDRETRGARDARPDPGARPRAAGRREPRWPDERGDSDLGDWNVSRHQRGWSDPRDEAGPEDWDRRPPPGPPSFGSPRDLASGPWYAGG